MYPEGRALQTVADRLARAVQAVQHARPQSWLAAQRGVYHVDKPDEAPAVVVDELTDHHAWIGHRHLRRNPRDVCQRRIDAPGGLWLTAMVCAAMCSRGQDPAALADSIRAAP